MNTRRFLWRLFRASPRLYVRYLALYILRFQLELLLPLGVRELFDACSPRRCAGSVEQEGMHAAVPDDVHEADESLVVHGAHQAEAAGQDRLPVLGANVLPGVRPQRVEGFAGNRRVVGKRYRHV
jgi:hypothetical protein